MFTIAGDMDHCLCRIIGNKHGSQSATLLPLSEGCGPTRLPGLVDEHNKLEKDHGLYQDEHSSTDLLGIKVWLVVISNAYLVVILKSFTKDIKIVQ